MSLFSELIEWAGGRPWWQQQALARLAGGDRFGPDEYAGVADSLLAPVPVPPPGGWLATMSHPQEPGGQSVRLLRIEDVANVNRLAADQVLSFADAGLTVVYGNNGSGKSGYARLVREFVRSRHREAILPDIFSTDGTEQAAALEYQVGTEVRTARLGQGAPPELAQVSFYDERCGDLYVTDEAEVIYRPAPLRLLDDLIKVCDGVRAELEARLTENGRSQSPLPRLAAGSRPALLIDRFDADVTDEDIVSACEVPDDAEQVIENARSEEARLRATDPAKERSRLSREAGHLTTVADHLEGLAAAVGQQVEQSLREAVRRATEHRAAADMASARTFEHEPLPGVGSATWHTLWEAARAYSITEAYPDREFPVRGEDAACVLCQQPLKADAGKRLERFDAFVTDRTEEQARQSRAELDRQRARLRGLQVHPVEVRVAIESLADGDASLRGEVDTLLSSFEARREALVDLALESNVPAAPSQAPMVGRLRKRASEVSEASESIASDGFDTKLQALVARRTDLEARLTLRDNRDQIIAERDRLRERAALEEARRQTDTRGITRTASDLTRDHVTRSVQDRFSRESQELGVERVTLLDKRGQRGVLLHKPDFIGATVPARLPQVLSEGEQTALGLAGYFVDAYFDTTKSALVLDDPVSSLDHLRRSSVAKRLAHYALDRQVIVFTHDVAMVATLRREADVAGVLFTARSVERRHGDSTPGLCVDRHPWTARDTKTRIHDLRQEVARIKREHGRWDADRYETEVSAWASKFSQAWERLVSEEVAGRIFDRGSLEVKVTSLKIAAAITPEENQTLQQSYSRCSGWTRHDQDLALGYVPPTPEELEAELNIIDTWYKQVKRYQSQG